MLVAASSYMTANWVFDIFEERKHNKELDLNNRYFVVFCEILFTNWSYFKLTVSCRVACRNTYEHFVFKLFSSPKTDWQKQKDSRTFSHFCIFLTKCKIIDGGQDDTSYSSHITAVTEYKPQLHVSATLFVLQGEEMANHLSESVPERTFQYQSSLPPLPVPSLESSLSKYLDAGRIMYHCYFFVNRYHANLKYLLKPML